jgi:hypothetical protein
MLYPKILNQMSAFISDTYVFRMQIFYSLHLFLFICGVLFYFKNKLINDKY